MINATAKGNIMLPSKFEEDPKQRHNKSLNCIHIMSLLFDVTF